ncbi:MAG: hypothetical protein HY659_14320 [Rhizobiales bacterium]|nr:hypothetical protein [Hyphomicrobiales bacterium]
MPKRQIENENRIIPLRPVMGGRSYSARDFHQSPVDDIEKFARTDEGDDYRHRMAMNAAALAVTIVLMLVGVWLATSIAQMRKNQDCVLSGKRGCTPVTAPLNQRW